MAHNVSTADRYYDKSEQREARHQCLDTIENTSYCNKIISGRLKEIKMSLGCFLMQETKHHSEYTLPYDIKTVPQFKINVIFM
jgi:hypothetical protein